MSEKTLQDKEVLLWQENFKKLDEYIDSLNIKKSDPRKKGELIKVLHKAQHIFGYLPDDVQKHVAAKLFLHHADVSGVVSFYNYFTTIPKGKFDISICMGTACYVKGADKVLAEFEKSLDIKAGDVTEDKRFSISVLRCVGACGLAPVVMVNEKVYGSVQAEDVSGILADYNTVEAE